MDKQWWAIAWPRTSTKARVSVQARRQRDDAPWSTSEIRPASEGLRVRPSPHRDYSILDFIVPTSSSPVQQSTLLATRHLILSSS